MRSWSIFVLGAGLGLLIGSGVATPVVKGQTANPLGGPLSHVALVVNNVDETARGLSDIFGVKVPEARVIRNVKYPPSYPGVLMNGKFITMQVNGVSFEMIEPLDGQSPWKDFLLAHGEGVHHVGFTVPDSDEARKVLESKGGRWTQDFAPVAAYVDMHPRFPITFEVVSPRK